jgi:nitroreductase
MDVITAIKGRRSVRSFLDKPVEKENLEQLIEAAVWAPSGGNGQNWRFVVITDAGMMKKIKMVSPGLLGGPPAVIIIAQDLETARHKGGEMGVESLTKMDSAIASQNIMLAAHSMGLGTCVIASFHPKAVGKMVKLPEKVLPQLLVSVGYPAMDPSPPPRKLEEVTWWEVYDG